MVSVGGSNGFRGRVQWFPWECPIVSVGVSNGLFVNNVGDVENFLFKICQLGQICQNLPDLTKPANLDRWMQQLDSNDEIEIKWYFSFDICMF